LNTINSIFCALMCVFLLACAGARADHQGIPQAEAPLSPAVAISHPGTLPTAAPTVAAPAGPLVPAAPMVVAEPYQCPLTKCVAVSKFGPRKTPDQTATEKHQGVCLRVTPGQTVRAARSGKVIFAGFSKDYVSRADKKDQQRLIIIMHADRESSRYVHLNTLAVRPPQEVLAGDVLGTASESDEFTEPVLHFEIRAVNGTPLDPQKYLAAKR